MTPRTRHLRSSLTALLLVGGAVQAEEPAAPQPTAQEPAPRNYVNLRAGVASLSRLPTMCLEVAPLEWLSLEACGPGSEYRAASKNPSLSHYRGWLRVDSWRLQVGWLQSRLGVGFAEVQVDKDSGGFQFSGVGPDGVETAGPEVGGSLRLLVPAFSGFELVGELNASLAYFHYGPELVRPRPVLEPSIGLTLGFGF
jgi:hypothetical protein